jgi:kynurenine formamidase
VFELEVFPFSFPDQEDNSQAFNEGVINASIGQVGTQFDALAHAGHDLGFYNCFSQSELGPNDSGELEKLGVENVRPFFTRAVLLDVVRHSDVPKMLVRGQQMVQDSYVITLDDVEQVLDNEGVEPPREGDVVIVYTGWDNLFGVDNDRYFNSPGVGIEVAGWLAEKRIAMLGSDTQASEALIDGLSAELAADPDALGAELGFIVNAVHFILITQNGIHLMELMRLGHLADAINRDFRLTSNDDPSPYEFLFAYSPIPIKGLSESPASPLAVR